MISRAFVVSIVVTLIALALWACSSDSSHDGGASSCPADLPAACPAAPPSFKADIEPLIERRCWGCHANGGVATPAHDFSTYDDIYRQRSAMLNQVYACNMPPADAGQLTPEERASLLSWFVCKSPDN